MTSLNDDQSIITLSDDSGYTNFVTKHLMKIRKKLIDHDAPAFYLGDSARIFKHKLVWKGIGRGNQLLTKESAEAVEQTDLAEEPEPGVPTSKHTADAATSMVVIDTPIEPALFSAIVFIDFDNCYLTPCGFWKGLTNSTEKFEDGKLSFHAKASPIGHILSQDFSIIVQNAKMLIDDTCLGGVKPSGFLVMTEKGENAIQFQHILFEVSFFLLFYFSQSIFLLIYSTENRLYIRRWF